MKIYLPSALGRAFNKLLYFSVIALPFIDATAQTAQNSVAKVTAIRQLNGSAAEVLFDDTQRLTIDFYGDHVFRLFQDPKGGIVRDPKATPPAQILTNQPRKAVGSLLISDNGNEVMVGTGKVSFVV